MEEIIELIKKAEIKYQLDVEFACDRSGIVTIKEFVYGIVLCSFASIEDLRNHLNS